MHDTPFLSMHLFKSTIAVFGKSILNILIDITLPSLPESILYSNVVIFDYVLF